MITIQRYEADRRDFAAMSDTNAAGVVTYLIAEPWAQDGPAPVLRSAGGRVRRYKSQRGAQKAADVLNAQLHAAEIAEVWDKAHAVDRMRDEFASDGAEAGRVRTRAVLSVADHDVHGWGQDSHAPVYHAAYWAAYRAEMTRLGAAVWDEAHTEDQFRSRVIYPTFYNLGGRHVDEGEQHNGTGILNGVRPQWHHTARRAYDLGYRIAANVLVDACWDEAHLENEWRALPPLTRPDDAHRPYGDGEAAGYAQAREYATSDHGRTVPTADQMTVPPRYAGDTRDALDWRSGYTAGVARYQLDRDVTDAITDLVAVLDRPEPEEPGGPEDAPCAFCGRVYPVPVMTSRYLMAGPLRAVERLMCPQHADRGLPLDDEPEPSGPVETTVLGRPDVFGHYHIGQNIPGYLPMADEHYPAESLRGALDALRGMLDDYADGFADQCEAQSPEDAERGSECCWACDAYWSVYAVMSGISDGDAYHHAVRNGGEISWTFSPENGPDTAFWVVRANDCTECERGDAPEPEPSEPEFTSWPGSVDSAAWSARDAEPEDDEDADDEPEHWSAEAPSDIAEAWEAYAEVSDDADRAGMSEETFTELYQGCYDDMEDFAKNLMDDLYGSEWDEHVEWFVQRGWFAPELDKIAWEQDYMIASTGHVFRCH